MKQIHIMIKRKARKGGASPSLSFLYGTAAGRTALHLLTARSVSRAAGAFMESPLSLPLIGPFIRSNGIDMSEYEAERYTCFNDFFVRRIRPEKRPVCDDPDALIAPADGLLLVYPVRSGTVVTV